MNMNKIAQRIIIIFLGVIIFQLYWIKKYLYNQCIVANGNTQWISATMNFQNSHLINSLSNITKYWNNILEYFNILSSLTK